MAPGLLASANVFCFFTPARRLVSWWLHTVSYSGQLARLTAAIYILLLEPTGATTYCYAQSLTPVYQLVSQQLSTVSCTCSQSCLTVTIHRPIAFTYPSGTSHGHYYIALCFILLMYAPTSDARVHNAACTSVSPVGANTTETFWAPLALGSRCDHSHYSPYS